MPNDNDNFQDLEHAARLVSSGCATVEEASRISGVPLSDLQARVSATKAVGRHAHAAPPDTTLYKRTAKGVLTITRTSRQFTTVHKDIFFSIDGHATAVDLAVRSNANAAYVYATLRAWEKEGYIAVVQRARAVDAGAINRNEEDADLDFTSGREPVQTAVPRSVTRESNATVTATIEATRVATESAEAQMGTPWPAPKQAPESVKQLSAQLAAERRSREDMAKALNEARMQAEREHVLVQRQREMLARMQAELLAARRAHQAQLTEQSARHAEQVRLLATLEAQRKTLEADLNKARMERECAVNLLATSMPLRQSSRDAPAPAALLRAL